MSTSLKQKFIRTLVMSPLTAWFFNSLYKFAYRFKFEKDLIKLEESRNQVRKLEAPLRKKFSDLKVLNGPFKGMRYPDFIAHGSAMYPKLLGSYESELYSALEELLITDYKTIIDVGCAEGYYAVGLAMRKPNATVYAYDVDKLAIEACKKMAQFNKVENRMKFEYFCSPETLINFDLTERSLIVCDCEGYEKELFTQQVVANLKNTDVLIELHDLYDERISPSILNVFKSSHNLKCVYSESTFKRLDDLGLRGDLTNEQIQKFFIERNGIMMWAIFTPKANNA